MQGYLILENGMRFKGECFGDTSIVSGEVVFNTGMTGYEEVLTDPSYYGQIVMMTYPLIGNYGINFQDMESNKPKVRGFIMRERCKTPSNWRSQVALEEFLKENKIIGIEGVDTRAITSILRESGTMRGIVTTKEFTDEEIREMFAAYKEEDFVEKVSTKAIYRISGTGKKIALIDFGVKKSIIESFARRDAEITVFPHDTKYEDIEGYNPDMIFLSNGPGDPEKMDKVIDNIKNMIGKKPITGICLGHQLLALALGGGTGKLKYGHRGCNHPVKDLRNGKIGITSQNHGYYVDDVPENMDVTHVNVNDGTVEGFMHRELPIFSVQFHPEASPGPGDMDYIFDDFIKYAGGENYAVK
ncbi:carbamoyl phosphate synthase small subunit [Oceanirhabdus seepicola]|uniref:Carbamoyl phosphate synthase small chain n=1 Tax=Oceanirhabdus seepicola TaxID=2828781 RepID=A0A9J6P696_9CLOT|nr:carbamoyl phosphate synthase small subunit [Oceanirhabdus seepicola]MCM1992107.1 carbamoyl phosphate synthase small subunit [Oceanirhabdus seepicola]